MAVFIVVILKGRGEEEAEEGTKKKSVCGFAVLKNQTERNSRNCYTILQTSTFHMKIVLYALAKTCQCGWWFSPSPPELRPTDQKPNRGVTSLTKVQPDSTINLPKQQLAKEEKEEEAKALAFKSSNIKKSFSW